MILPDVNILVYASREAAPQYRAARAWLRATMSGPEPLALTDATASGLVRITTDPRIVAVPTAVREAVGFVDDVLAAPGTVWLGMNHAVWDRLRQLVHGDPRIRGRVVPDALLAATAIAHGARLATSDRGMARFPGLQFFDPLAG